MVSHFKTVLRKRKLGILSDTFIMLFCLPKTYFFIPVGAYNLCVS